MATQQQVWDIARLYEGALDRDGAIDKAGLNYWVGRFDQGASLEAIARVFFDNPEFVENYGPVDALSDGQLVDRLYLNVLGREPDDLGRAYWVDRLAEGLARERLLIEFVTSDENAEATSYVEDIAEIAPGEWFYPAPEGDAVPGGPQSAETIAPGEARVQGIQTGDDADWFALSLEGGTVYEIAVEVFGALDAEIRLYTDAPGETGVPFAEKDAEGAGTGELLLFEPVADARIWVEVVAYEGGSTGDYELSVRPSDPQTRDNSRDPDTNGHVRLVDGVWSSDGRDGPAGGASVGAADIYDWWAAYLVEGEEYAIDLFGSGPDPHEDIDLYVYDISELQQAGSADFGDDSLVFVPDYTGTHFIEVQHFDDPDDVGTYTLEVELV